MPDMPPMPMPMPTPPAAALGDGMNNDMSMPDMPPMPMPMPTPPPAALGDGIICPFLGSIMKYRQCCISNGIMPSYHQRNYLPAMNNDMSMPDMPPMPMPTPPPAALGDGIICPFLGSIMKYRQ